jgi:hypothetical protein
MSSELLEMLKVVCAFIARPESDPFRRPVDWKAMGLLDYPQVIVAKSINIIPL